MWHQFAIGVLLMERMYDYILCLLEKQNMFQTLSKAEM